MTIQRWLEFGQVFTEPLAVEVGKIKEMAARTQKTMRLAKKAIERIGDPP